MIAITGASGQLGHLVIEQLLKKIEPAQIAALVRIPEKAADLQQKGCGTQNGRRLKTRHIGSGTERC